MVRGRSGGLRSFFEPKSVAVAGVSDDRNKLGSIIFANLCENEEKGKLKAPVYALNPSHASIGGRPCYPKIRSLPETPELLVIAVPVPLTLDLVREAAEEGVKAVVIVTSGFAEAGRRDLEEQVGKVAASHGMRILGPNTIGVLDTRSGVDTLFLRPTKTLPNGSEISSLLKPLEGNVAIITQSGHLGEVVSEALASEGVGIRALVGTGNQLDVSVEEVLEHFAEDQNTKVVALYIEGIAQGRRFMSAAARAARKKPVIVLKVGKTSEGARAALTHTASLVGDYPVYQAAFRRCGLVEASGLQELVDYSVSFSMLPDLKGRGIVVITNAGGVGAIASDEAARVGLEVRPLGEEAEARLRSEFGNAGFMSNASLRNPVDLTASVTTEEFVRITKFALSLPQYDAALLLPTHQTPSISHDIPARLAEAMSGTGKPAVVCVMGQSALAARIHADFLSRGIPAIPTPERAVRVISAAAEYGTARLRASEPASLKTRDVITTLRRWKGPLAQPEVSRLLRSYGIIEPKSVLVRSTRDISAAGPLGLPVACKLLSGEMLHKTEAGGVVLNVDSPGELSAVFSRFRGIASRRKVRFDGMLVQRMVGRGVEVILGGTRDPAFGPTVLVGAGGTYAELARESVVAVAPLTPHESEELLVGTKLRPVLDGYRGGPKADMKKLSATISSFSKIMVENPSIEQMEVNPLIASEEGCFAVDARVIVSPRHATPPRSR